jgi:hypothetical protein
VAWVAIDDGGYVADVGMHDDCAGQDEAQAATKEAEEESEDEEDDEEFLMDPVDEVTERILSLYVFEVEHNSNLTRLA